MAQDIYERIRDNIVNQLENGTIPWVKCFHTADAGCAYSHSSQNPYSLLNQFLLCRTGEYWTFQQAKNAGFHIRKGAKGSFIVFWKILEKERENEEKTDKIPYLRWYSVFHESDVDGLPAKTPVDETDRETRNSERLDLAENIVDEYIRRNERIALCVSARTTPCWSQANETIYVPEKSQFDSLADYYAALFHEMVHSTGRALDRKLNYRDMKDRAKEELVAEIGSAYLCGKCGITEDVIKNQSAYCRNWLQPLKDDIKILVWASSRAERAVKHILGECSEEVSESES